MKTPSTVGFVVFAFIAGFVATIVFNQSAGFVLSKVGLAPPGFTAWALDPVRPWGVPTVVSKAFCGLWAVPLGLVLRFTRGGATGRAGYCTAQRCPRLLVSSSYPRSRGCLYPTSQRAFPSAPASTVPGALELRLSSGSRARRDANSTITGKTRLLNRVRGQIEALERAIENERGRAAILHLGVGARRHIRPHG